MSLLKKIKFKIFDFWILGLSTPPNPKQVYRKLKDKKTAIQELGLRKVAKCYVQKQDHKKYNALLEFFVSGLNLVNAQTVFYGKGGSGSSLNTYRKVRIGDEFYFEKVYFNHYPEVGKMLWFQKEICPQLKSTIKVPVIKQVYQGEVITVIYFEFLTLNTLDSENLELQLIQFSKILKNCSEKIRIEKLPTSFDICDFENYYRFKNNVSQASKIIDTESFIKNAKKSPKVLTHGDIQRDNAFGNSVLIDWDVMGYYPIGLEQATIYLVLFLKNQTIGYPAVWLKKHYTEVFYLENQIDFKRNFIFFLFVFFLPWFQKNEFLDLKKELEKEIKCFVDYKPANFS